MRKTILAAALAAITIPFATPALADPPGWAPAHGRRAHEEARDDHRDGDGRWGRDERREYRRDDRRQAYRDRVLSRDDRVWYSNGAYRCRRNDGTTGTIIGAALGGLLGNSIAGRGDKTLGAIVGAVGGGVLGNTIDRGNVRCR
jgi:hypothetical protein